MLLRYFISFLPPHNKHTLARGSGARDYIRNAVGARQVLHHASAIKKAQVARPGNAAVVSKQRIHLSSVELPASPFIQRRWVMKGQRDKPQPAKRYLRKVDRQTIRALLTRHDNARSENKISSRNC